MDKDGYGEFFPILGNHGVVLEGRVSTFFKCGPKGFQMFNWKLLAEIGQGAQAGKHKVWQEHTSFFLLLFQGFCVNAPGSDHGWLRHKHIFDEPCTYISLNIGWVLSMAASLCQIMKFWVCGTIQHGLLS